MVTDSIQATIQGEVTGQVAVGHHIVQIGSVHGGVVNVVMPHEQPQPRPRPIPVLLRPRPFPGLLDREEEIAAAADLAPGAAVELHGQPGVGKTALLRHLAHLEEGDDLPDGTVCLSARSQPLGDLYQSLFDAFYEAESAFKVSEAWLRHAFSGLRARILLDDVELTREDLETLRGLAPACAWLFAAGERRLWDEGRSLPVAGLPLDAALEPVARQLGRPLEAAERPAARQLCEALGGHPLRLLQVLAPVTEGEAAERRSLEAVAARAAAAAEPQETEADELTAQPEQRRRILAVLAAVGGAPLSAANLQAITGDRAVAASLAELERSGLVEATDREPPRYRLRTHLLRVAARSLDVAPWQERTGERLAAWAEENRRRPRRVFEEAGALRQLLAGQVAAGRWPAALRTARAIEGPCALAGRWDAWSAVLHQALSSARESGDRAAEAWARHQLGTRALCLEDGETARGDLGEALRLREALGDAAGAAVTRHNLDLLPPPAQGEGPQEERPQEGPGAPDRWWRSTLAKGVLGALAIALLVALGAVIWSRSTPSPPPLGPVPSPPGPVPVRPTPVAPGPSRSPVAPRAELAGLRVGPASIVGGESGEGKVVLRRPAGVGGVGVELASSAPDVAEVPPRVEVAPGQQGAGFRVETRAVETPRSVRITATLAGRREVTEIELRPRPVAEVELAGLRLEPTSVRAGGTAQAEILLTGPAPPDGVAVQLASDPPGLFEHPPVVRIPPGRRGARVPLRAASVEEGRRVVLVAHLGQREMRAGLTIEAPPRPPDPAARRIDLRIVARQSRFAGRVRITGVVANLGGPFISTPGRQEAVLLEVPLGGQPRVVARKAFIRLEPGAELQLDYERRWNSSSPSEGEFPPSYVLEVHCDRRLARDSDPRNDDADPQNDRLERPGSEINRLFQEP